MKSTKGGNSILTRDYCLKVIFKKVNYYIRETDHSVYQGDRLDYIHHLNYVCCLIEATV